MIHLNIKSKKYLKACQSWPEESVIYVFYYNEELYFELFGREFSILYVSSQAQRSHGWRGESLLHTHSHTWIMLADVSELSSIRATGSF